LWAKRCQLVKHGVHKMKYVTDTKSAKSIGAWIILKRHKLVAKVLAHYSDGGTCLVNVFNYNNKSSEKLGFQAGKASGYGYDKLTAALRGMEIDGHKLTDHCQTRKTPKDYGLARFPKDFKAPKGWHLSNWEHYTTVRKEGTEDYERVDIPADEQGYTDLYRKSGLKYLESMGYTVISAL
jgi:hypothetical protein